MKGGETSAVAHLFPRHGRRGLGEGGQGAGEAQQGGGERAALQHDGFLAEGSLRA